MKIELISCSPNLREDDVWVYHVRGVSQQLGTCKLHKSPECPVLKKWKPAPLIDKIIIQDNRKYNELEEKEVCKFCW